MLILLLERPKRLRTKRCFTLLLACRIKRCSFNAATGRIVNCFAPPAFALNKFFLSGGKKVLSSGPTYFSLFLFFRLFFRPRIVRSVYIQYYPASFQRMSCNFGGTKADEKITLKFASPLFSRDVGKSDRTKLRDVRLARNASKRFVGRSTPSEKRRLAFRCASRWILFRRETSESLDTPCVFQVSFPIRKLSSYSTANGDTGTGGR